MGLLMTASMWAQAMPESPVVSQDEIVFWTGKGSNRAVIAVTWNDAVAGNIGFAWGVQWNGTANVFDLMDTIATYDSRFSLDGTSTYITNINYVDNQLGVDLHGVVSEDYGMAFWWYNWKNASGVNKESNGVAADIVENGDFVDWLPMDPETYETSIADEMFMATEPMPDEATIAPADIKYWVGTGSKSAVLAVNWADTALAWGYRFDGNATVGDMMNAIAEADKRFSVEIGSFGIDDILFAVSASDTLRKQTYSYWESRNNGVMDAGVAQPLSDGDFEKWAEPAAGVVVDSVYYEEYDFWSYVYVYPMEIHPVSVYVGINNIEAVNVTIYPNPVANVLNVSFEALPYAFQATLFDMSGRTVAVRTVAAGSNSMQLDVANMPAGNYLLNMGGCTTKVVVRH